MLLTVERGDPWTHPKATPGSTATHKTWLCHSQTTGRERIHGYARNVSGIPNNQALTVNFFLIFLWLWPLRFPNTVGFHSIILHELHRQAHSEGAWGNQETGQAQMVFVSQSRQNFSESSSLTQRGILRQRCEKGTQLMKQQEISSKLFLNLTLISPY